MKRHISSTEDLLMTIEYLKTVQSDKKQLMDEQFRQFNNKIMPVNLVKESLRNLVSSPAIIDNIFGTASGILTGYLSKLIITGSSKSKVRKLAGLLFQLVITAFIVRHSESVKIFSRVILDRYLAGSRTD